MSFLEKISALGRGLKAFGGAGAALAIACLAFLLRRRTAQLRTARLEVSEQKENCQNEKVADEITSIEKKVEDDEKDRLAKLALLRHLLDRGDDDSGPRN